MDYRDEAEKIVIPFYGYTISKVNAIRCAIIHVNGIMEQLEFGIPDNGQEEFWTSILDELKLMENGGS